MDSSTLMTLLPLGLVVLIGMWIAMKYRREAASANVGPHGITPYGVQGWLRFFIFVSYVISPLIGISRLSTELRMAEE